MISDFYKQSITWKQVTGRDIDGMQVTDSGTATVGRLQETGNTKVTIDNLGTEVVTNAELWCSYELDIKVGDLIECDGVTYEIITVETKRVGSGATHHNKARLKRTREE